MEKRLSASGSPKSPWWVIRLLSLCWRRFARPPQLERPTMSVRWKDHFIRRHAFCREQTRLLEFCDATILDMIGSTEGAIGMSVMNRDTSMVATAHFMQMKPQKSLRTTGSRSCPGAAPWKSRKFGRGAHRLFQGCGKNGQYFSHDQRNTICVRWRLWNRCRRWNASRSRPWVELHNTGGEKVFPEEVEEALKAHHDVLDCLVVGVPDEIFVERVVAIVSLRRALS